MVKKPAYVGICVLDLRKVLMYEFHYDYIKDKYGNKSGLLFSDTDCLMQKIKTEYVFSNYSANSKYYDDSNKLVAGKMKDETSGIAIKEFVGLKPQIHSFLVDDHKRVKGVNKNVVATISHSKYKDVLLDNRCLKHSMNRIDSKNHKIITYEINKISLSCFDDKI